MDFKNKILDFLKEDIDNIRSLKVSAAADEKTALRLRDTPPDDVSSKSYFLEDYVHQIVFKNLVQGQKRLYYKIYRKITKEEYDKLKKNYQVTYGIKPTDIEDHAEDVYYTAEREFTVTPKFTTDTKKVKTKNFIYLKKEQAELYNSKLPSEYKLELVPTKDIYEKGIGARSMSIKDYIDFVENEEKKKSAPKKDYVPVKQSKEKVIDFFSDENIKKLIKKIVVSYKKRFSADSSKEDREDATQKYKQARKGLSDEIKRLVFNNTENKDKIEELIFSELKEKFVSEKLFNYFEKYYEEDETDSSLEKPAEVEPSSKEKSKSTNKYTPKDDKKVDTSRTSIEPTGDFLSKGNNTSTLRTAIQLYSDFLYAKSKEDKDLFSGKFYDKAIQLVSSVVNDTKDLKSSEKAMSEIEEYIKEFFKKQLIPENPDLYNRIKTIYDKMKQAKSSQRITEAEEKKDYVVATVVPDKDNPELNAQPYKQYNSNLNKRLTGVAGEFILKLDKKGADYIKRMSLDVTADGVPKKGIISITPADQYKKGERTKKDGTVKKLKGYRSASGAKKVKIATPDTYFDPKNPNDIAALKGKAKPGEKVYNVNFKIGSKSDDVRMTLSQIKKFVPDFKVVPDAKQQPVFDFEIEKPRTTSKDTGKTVYDIVKGSLKLNSSRAINEPTQPTQQGTDYRSAQFFVINKNNKRVLKGFATEKEADDFAKGMKSPEYISVNKLNLSKYGVTSTNVDKKAFAPEKETPKDDKETAPTQAEKPTSSSTLPGFPKRFYLVEFPNKNLYPNGRVVRDEKGEPVGDDTRDGDNITSKMATMPASVRIYRTMELKGKQVNLDPPKSKKNPKLSENLTDEDKKTIKNKSVSFKIELGKNDPDAVAEVEGNVRESVYKDKKVTLTMDDGSKAVFSDPTMGKYYKNPNDLQNFNIINDTDPPLTEVLKKVFSAKKSETQLEAYIRQRIRRALQEIELAQSIRVQGPAVKKKRLEEYMKR